MNILSNGPIQSNPSPQLITILVDDPNLSEAVAECPTPQAKSELVQDLAEVGARILDRHQTDQNVQSVVDALERQNDQARTRYEEQRSDERARWEQQRQIERQIREQQAASEKQRYEAQLAEQKRQFETQLENQKAYFERRAETARRLQTEEREAHQRELQELTATVGGLSNVISGAFQDMTGDIQNSFDRASLIIQNQTEREEARRQADELRERTSNYKGVAFERGLLNDLIEFAGTRTGDQVEHTGANPEDGSARKSGDLVYTLQTQNGPVKVALEAKDQKLKHSGDKKYFLDELNGAREIRGAKYGIVVASLDENSVGDSRPRDPFFKDLGDGNFLVIVDETQPYSVALRTALHWIHNLEKKSSNGDVDKKLFESVQVGLGRIAQLNDRFTTLKRTTTSVINSLDRLRGQLDGLDADMTAEVERLKQLLE